MLSQKRKKSDRLFAVEEQLSATPQWAFLVHHPVLILGYALSCTTLRVVGITTRSVVQLSLPTQVFSLDDAIGLDFVTGGTGGTPRGTKGV